MKNLKNNAICSIIMKLLTAAAAATGLILCFGDAGECFRLQQGDALFYGFILLDFIYCASRFGNVIYLHKNRKQEK